MIKKQISDRVLTVGPSPDMQGGIAQVLETYFDEVFDSPRFIPDTVKGPQPKRMAASLLAAFRLWYTLLRNKDIRIVHLHTAHKVSFPRSAFYARIVRLMGRKTVLHMHGSEFRSYYDAHPRATQRALEKADRIVALSESWRRYFTDTLGLKRVTVIDNIISAPHPRPELRESTGDTVHALFLGQIGDRKGIFDLLEAMHRHRDALQGRFMLHVGGNGDIIRFDRKVDELGLRPMVTFHGWVKGDDKERLLSLSRIFILPSYAEGLPISILEAMAYGNAVIASTVGGIPEIVDSTTGILVEAGDIDAIGDALMRLVEDPALTAGMGRSGLRRTSSHLADAVSARLEELYLSLMAEK